jgi:hypothetical protein
MTTENKYAWNRKGFIARDWVIAMLIFGALVAIAALVFSDMAREYDNPGVIDPMFNKSYDTFTSTTADTKTMYESVTTGGGLKVIGTANLMFNAIFTVINLVLSSLALPGTVLKNFMVDFGVPDAIGNIFMALYVIVPTVLIIFIVLSSQSRRDI